MPAVTTDIRSCMPSHCILANLHPCFVQLMLMCTYIDCIIMVARCQCASTSLSSLSACMPARENAARDGNHCQAEVAFFPSAIPLHSQTCLGSANVLVELLGPGYDFL